MGTHPMSGRCAHNAETPGSILGPAIETAPRPRIIQTKDGPQDLGAEYEAIYHLADTIADVLDIEGGDALDEALRLFAEYPDGSPEPFARPVRAMRDESSRFDLYRIDDAKGRTIAESVALKDVGLIARAINAYRSTP